MLLILLAPGAQAIETSGSLTLPEGARLEGALVARAHAAIADLSPIAEADSFPALEWGAASMRVVSSERDYYTNADVYVQNTDDAVIETATMGAGSLRSLECIGECKVFAFSDPEDDAAWIVRGGVRGPLRRVPQEVEYWSGSNLGGPDSFLYPVPAGWLNLSSMPARPWEPTLLSDSSIDLRGSFGILLWGATAVLQTEDGERTIRTGSFEEATAGPAGTTLQRRTVNRFVVLGLTEGSLATPAAAPFLFHAPDARLDLDGSLSAREAHGTLVLGSKRLDLRGETLRIEGDLALGPDLPVPIGSDLAVQDAQEHAVETSLDGDASRVFVNGARVGSEPAISTPVTVGLTIAGLLVLALAALKLAGLMPVYTRITPETALRNDNRREIYDRLRATTGATIPELIAATGMAEAVVRHHLRVLEEQKLIVERREGRTKAYFRSDIQTRPEVLAVQLALRDDSRRLVCETLCRAPLPLTQSELATMTGLSQRLVSYHLGKLEKKGLVVGDGLMPRRYRPADALLRQIMGGHRSAQAA